MNYYERHLGDYARDCGHLSLLEEGVYTRLLDRYYASEQPLPADQVYRITRASSRPERAAVDAVLREFFVKDGDLYRHKRCDAEIERTQEKKRKAKASADARWRTGSEMPTHSGRNANALPTQCEGNALQSPVTSHQKKELAAQAPPPRKRGSRLPADWQPSEADAAYLKAKRPDLSLDRTAEDFRDYWHAQAGADAAKLDWPATWRRWVRNQRAPTVGAQPPPARPVAGNSPEQPREDPLTATLGWLRQQHDLGLLSDTAYRSKVEEARRAA